MSTDSELLPANIDLCRLFPPLTDCFNKCEAEAAAAALIRTLQQKGNTWRPVRLAELLETLRGDLEEARALGEGAAPAAKMFLALERNPFFRPSFEELIKRGFARWLGDPREAIEFTFAGLARLQTWCAKYCSPATP